MEYDEIVRKLQAGGLIDAGEAIVYAQHAIAAHLDHLKKTISVTPEMARAGSRILEDRYEPYSAEEDASDVFLAMFRLASLGPTLGNDPSQKP